MYVNYLLSALSQNNTEFCKSLFLQNGNHCPNILKPKNEGIIQVKKLFEIVDKTFVKKQTNDKCCFSIMSYFSSYIMLNCYGKRRCRRLLRDGDDDKRLTNVLHQFFLQILGFKKSFVLAVYKLFQNYESLDKSFYLHILFIYQTRDLLQSRILIQKYYQKNSNQRNIKKFPKRYLPCRRIIW